LAEEVLVCPFCGAPHSESIPAGVVQVKCHYCGAEVLVPPRLGGAIQRCPNHPEVLALGLCNDCGKSFCDQCLYVLEAEQSRLNVCSKCYESRNVMGKAVSIIGFVFSITFLLLFFVVIVNPYHSDSSSAMGMLFVGVLLLAVSLASMHMKNKPISVHDFRARAASRVFMKKCVKCGKEIPIASEQCQYCEADQSEHAS